MLVETKELPPIGTNAIALINPELKEMVVVDAPAEAYDWACGLVDQHGCKIIALFLTHGHWDHILDAWRFAEAGIPTYGHINDAGMFAEPSRMAAYAMPGLELKPVKINHWVAQGKRLQLLHTRFEIRHVPGHCPGNILLYLKEHNLAVVGDAIFAGSVGRYDLPGGDFSTLEHSIRTQIYSLPDETTIYPGHGPSTTVSAEKESNPFVRP